MKYFITIVSFFTFACSDAPSKSTPSANNQNNNGIDAGLDQDSGVSVFEECTIREVELDDGTCERRDFLSVQALASTNEIVGEPFNILSVFSTPAAFEFDLPSLRRDGSCDTFLSSERDLPNVPLLDAGTVTIVTPDYEFVFRPDADLGRYEPDDSPPRFDWFTPPLTATIMIEGGEDFPAFETSMDVVDPPVINDAPALDLTSDYSFSWSSRGADVTQVELVFRAGTELGRVQCFADDTGRYTIPFEAIEPVVGLNFDRVTLSITQNTSRVSEQANGSLIQTRSRNGRTVQIELAE